VRTRTFKISNKVETSSNGKDIVYRKVSRVIEQGFMAISKPYDDQFLTRLASYSQHCSDTTL